MKKAKWQQSLPAIGWELLRIVRFDRIGFDETLRLSLKQNRILPL